MLVAALVCAGSALGADVGANDDTGKYAPDGGAVFFPKMAALGLRQTVMTVRFKPSEPTTIHEQDFLDRAVPEATKAGLRVVLAVYPYPPSEVEAGLSDPFAFGQFTATLARRYPFVKQFVIGNEPNQPAFLRPQFDGFGVNESARVAGEHLAAASAALKAVDPLIRVVGVGLSPRGNDRPAAASNVSTSPVRFLRALGAWYRTSGRWARLMDGLSFHPYPNVATDSLYRGYSWPNAGYANLDRIKQAIWDAFHGTPQPTTVNGLTLHLDEVGWQVDTTGQAGYTGVENVKVTDEWSQAFVYADIVRQAACDPVIAEVNIFGFHDDAALEGFQAGLHRVDGSPRPSAELVGAAITETTAGCAGLPVTWRPTARVVGATRPAVTPLVNWVRVDVPAAEGATVRACLVSATVARPQALRTLQRAGNAPGCATGVALPGRDAKLKLRRIGPGPTQIAVRVTAETNTARRTEFAFRVR